MCTEYGENICYFNIRNVYRIWGKIYVIFKEISITEDTCKNT